MNDNPRWQILQGDALQLLPNFVPGTFDAIITDPPYASGGRTQAEKNKSPAKKYSSMGDHAPPPFDGDSKDQRSWTRWAAERLSDARKLCKPGAPECMRDIVKITEPGGHILDPFAGSGTTVLAAVLEGYTATGIEVTDEYARLARERIKKELETCA